MGRFEGILLVFFDRTGQIVLEVVSDIDDGGVVLPLGMDE